LVNEEPVGVIQERRFEPTERIEHLSRGGDERVCDRRPDEREARRGQDAAHPPRVEPGELDPAEPREIAQHDARHEVARKDEEHVDADEPTREGAEARVKRYDQVDGEAAHSIEIRPIAQLASPVGHDPSSLRRSRTKNDTRRHA
jgi:hypothetical protein